MAARDRHKSSAKGRKQETCQALRSFRKVARYGPFGGNIGKKPLARSRFLTDKNKPSGGSSWIKTLES